MKRGHKARRMSPKHQGGEGIMPQQFSGKKPKVETPRVKKAREKRLSKMAM